MRGIFSRGGNHSADFRVWPGTFRRRRRFARENPILVPRPRGLVPLRSARAGVRRGAEDRVREIHPPERAASNPPRGQEAPDRPRERVVPRRQQEREARADGVRPPVRAPHVRGLERRTGQVPHVRREARRESAGRRRERHDEPGSDELLHHGPGRRPRARPLARVRPPRDAHGLPDEREPRPPARGRQEREAAGPREHALRARVQAHLRIGLPGRAPVLVAHDRQPGGPLGGDVRRREGLLQDLLHAEQPLAHRRGRLRSGRSEAARHQVLRPDPARPRPRPTRPVRPGVLRREGRGGRRPRSAGARLRRLPVTPVLRKGRRRARPRVSHPHGRPLLAPPEGARLRPAALLDGPGVAEQRGDLRALLRVGDGAPGRPARGRRARRDGRDRATRKGRSDGHRARPREDEIRVPVRLGPGGHRGLRREVRPAQPLQHVPRRPGQARRGPRPLPARHPGRRARRGREVDRHAEPGPRALPSRDLRPRELPRDRSLAGASRGLRTPRSTRPT